LVFLDNPSCASAHIHFVSNNHFRNVNRRSRFTHRYKMGSTAVSEDNAGTTICLSFNKLGTHNITHTWTLGKIDISH